MHHFSWMGGENEAGFAQTNPATWYCPLYVYMHARLSGGSCTSIKSIDRYPSTMPKLVAYNLERNVTKTEFRLAILQASRV